MMGQMTPERMREAAKWFCSNVPCCEEYDSTGTCAATACSWGEVARGLGEGADQIEKLEKEKKDWCVEFCNWAFKQEGYTTTEVAYDEWLRQGCPKAQPEAPANLKPKRVECPHCPHVQDYKPFAGWLQCEDCMGTFKAEQWREPCD